MGARISSAYACRQEAGEKFVALSARAAAGALCAAGRDASDLDLLVSAGIYRDGHAAEPAMAPLVQARLGARLEPALHTASAPTLLSFDLANGGCGVLDAARLVDGLFRSGRARRALVVAADVDPAPGVSSGLGFDASGGALVLEAGRDDEGFLAFASESFAKHVHLSDAVLAWRDGPRPGHAVVRREDPRYRDECARCAARAVARFLARVGRDPRDLDLVIPAQSPRGFPRAFAARVALGAEVIDACHEIGSAYTAGVPAAVHAAMRRGVWQRARTVLFVGVGAGIGVAAALYAKRAGDSAGLATEPGRWCG
jgi:3-oxoacyl-[acyl-carrier-protein] synthase-3